MNMPARALRAALVLSMVMVSLAGATPPVDKTLVCHLAKSDGFFEPLEVANQSLAKHLEHGDCIIDDGVACTADFCDPYQGCVNRPDDAVCDDGVFCNGTETCGASGCVVASACPPIVLECGVQACDETKDECVIVPNDAECNDGEPCTDDVCTAGTCGAVPDASNSCDDGVFCNGAESCTDGGACVSVSACPPVVLECGNQECDEDADACVIVPDDTDCDDGLACTTNQCRANGTCRFPDVSCPFGKDCNETAGMCVPVTCPCWDGSEGSAGTSLQDIWKRKVPVNCDNLDLCGETVRKTGYVVDEECHPLRYLESSSARCDSIECNANGCIGHTLITEASRTITDDDGETRDCTVFPVIYHLDLNPEQYEACKRDHDAFTATTSFPSVSGCDESKTNEDTACGLPTPGGDG